MDQKVMRLFSLFRLESHPEKCLPVHLVFVHLQPVS